MKRATLPLLAAILVSPSIMAQFGGMMNPAMMVNPVTMGMMNPSMLMNPMTMGMMSPAMMSPMGGLPGMNPAQFMGNPYLNPTSSLMPFLGAPAPTAFGNPYLMPTPQPRQATGFLPFLPAQAAPAPQGYRAPQSAYGAMMPQPAPARATAPAYGYGMPAPSPAAAPTTNMGAFMPYYPASPAAAPQTPAPQEAPAANMFDAAAWAQMFPNSVPPSPQPQAAPAAATAPAQPAVPAGAPNYFDPNMWMQWMAPASPK